MTLEQMIRDAVSFTGLPCAANEYTGSADAYLVMNMTTMPDEYADDVPGSERQLVQLHLYCQVKKNTVELRKKIKRAISDAGCTYPSMTDVSDKSGQHLVFEFEHVEAV